MGRKSRNKGASFENKIARMIGSALGITLRRTPLSGGWATGNANVAGDIVCVDDTINFPYCVECKKQEGWKLESLLLYDHAWFDAWWEQLMTECPNTKIPVLVFSRNYQPEFVAIKANAESMPTYPALLTTVNGELVIVSILTFWLEFSIKEE